MPDPRIRRSRSHGPRQGRPAREAAPPEASEPAVDPASPGGAAAEPTEAPASSGIEATETSAGAGIAAATYLKPDDAASAEAEAEELAAGDVAGDAMVEATEPETAEERPGESGDVSAEPAAETETAEPAAEEPAGWFREEPLDEGEEPGADEVEEPLDEGEEPGAGEGDEELVAGSAIVATPTADDEVMARDRDRPIVAAPPDEAPPRRGGRLRRILIGLVTIIAVAAVGFVAGLMLPVILPGPGITTEGPSPSVAPSEVPTIAPTLAPTIAPTPPPTSVPTASPTPEPTPLTYVVKAGDNLTAIANKYGVTVAAIMKANKIKDANLIQKGQKLVIPAKTPAP